MGVKSETVIIQGQYKPTIATSGLAVMTGIAFGGSFLKGNKLIISTRSATFNGQAILTTFPGSYNNPALGIAIQYDGVGHTMQKGREGKDLHVIHLTLPSNVQVQINRWMEPTEGDYINARITMPPQPNQDGHCGNFNGNQQDDDRLQIRARIGTTGVEPNLLILPGGKIPVGQSTRPDINNCPGAKLKHAKEICKRKEGKFIPSM